MENKFRLRQLKICDANLMLEWMHDDDVIKDLENNFKKKTIEDCICFIENSISDRNNCNLAIVDDTDTYLGTVSIKNINHITKTGEFAITVRKSVMGSGCSTFAIHEIIKYGFDILGLEKIYWYVSKKNLRAIKFYDKNRYSRIKYSHLIEKISEIESLNNKEYIWYLVENN